MNARLSELIESSDLDGLVRFIDALCAGRDWDGLVELRDRCDEAVERGKQLWGTAQFAEYRLALEAPGEYAGAVVLDGAGRYALGPLWEVAASTHEWAELAPHVISPRSRALIAHERVIRGEIFDTATIDTHVVDVPLRLYEWEPRYPVASYRSDKADFPELDPPSLEWRDLGDRGEPVEDDAVGALSELVRPWVEESSGRAEAIAVDGDAPSAIRSLGPHRVRLARVSFERALGAMAWAAASGGAYGRRRGTPVGRFEAWYATASLLGLEEEWPVDPAALADEGPTLEWYLWDPGDTIGGWALHIAVEDPNAGLAWALSAVDAR